MFGVKKSASLCAVTFMTKHNHEGRNNKQTNTFNSINKILV